MEVRLLGPIEAVVDGEVIDLGSGRPAQVLVALAMAVGHRLTVDELVDRWVAEAAGPDDPVPALRTAVRRLRRLLGDETIATHRGGGGYELDLTDATIDIDSFEHLIAAGRATSDPVAAQTTFRRALELWRGTPFGELGDLDWLIPDRSRLEELHLIALEGWHDAHLRNGSATEIVPSLEAATSAHPLRERLRRQLMHALFLTDRQSEALRVFQELRAELIEAGLEPSAETIALEQRIAAGDPSLRVANAGRSLRGYQIEERLGEGAFSIVYRGTQPSVGRDVAVKQIRAELANRPEFIRRFETEAHLVARLEHPYIVPLYDYWREPDSAYLVMRYLRGGNLETRLYDGRWDLDKTLAMVHQIGDALATSHRAGVVHRDVKPANILLDEEGNAYLADFGIALEAAEAADPEAALSAGSPAYASPEQLQRLPVGPPADVHGLAIATYEALTGRLPFPDEPNQAAMVQRQLNDPIPPVRDTRADIPTAVDAVLAKATAKSPRDRYQSVEEFVVALDDAAANGAGHVAASAGGSRRTMVVAEERNPYKGLRAFDEADAADFTGRARLIDQLVEALDRSRLVAVVGPSGSGKSSVVRAGLLPAVRAGRVPGSARWFITRMMPGANPFEELERALLRIASERHADLLSVLTSGERGIARAVHHAIPDSDDQVLLVLDQFEELFTLADPAETQAFLKALAIAVTDERSRLRVVLTLRADFFDRPLRHEGFGALVKDATIAVLPLAPDELERAIVDPAHAVGAEFEPGLVAEIAADVVDQPGALPLLQYALTELYEARHSGLMTRDAYRTLGGVSGALARRAEDLYQEADGDERAAIRRIFGRLVSLGEGTEDTRRRALRAELGDDAATAAVIDRYGAARLLSFDRDPISREPTVEVAHEALLREWPRLRDWLDEDRDGLRILRHLHTTANEWDRTGRPDAELYRGGRLEAAEELAAARPEDLRPLERDFVEAAIARRHAEAETEQRTNRRLRRLLAGVGVVAAIALVAGAFAFVQRSRANDQAERAETTAYDAETGRLAAAAATRAEEDISLGLLLAVEARSREDSPATLGALQRVLTKSGPFLGLIGHGRETRELSFAEDGRIIGIGPHAITTYNALTHEVVGEFAFNVQETETIRLDGLITTHATAAVAPDATRIAAVPSSDPTLVVVLSQSDGTELGRIEHEVAVASIAFSPSGAQFATLDRGGLVRVFDAVDFRELSRFEAHPEQLLAEQTFGPDISVMEIPPDLPLLGGGAGNRGFVLFAGPDAIITAAGFDTRRFDWRNGLLLDDQDLALPYTDTPLRSRWVQDAAPYSQDATLLWAFESQVQAFDLGSSERRDGFVEGTGLVGGTPKVVEVESAGPDQAWVLLSDGRVLRVEISTGTTSSSYDTGLTDPSGLAVSHDLRTVAVGGTEGIVLLATDGAGLIAEAGPLGNNDTLSIGTSGDTVVGGNSQFEQTDNSAWRFRDDTLEAIPGNVFGFGDAPHAPIFFEGGDRLAVTLRDPDHFAKLAMADTETFEILTIFDNVRNWTGRAISLDGSFVAIGEAGNAVLYDAQTGERLAVYESGATTNYTLAFSPDGSRLVATFNDRPAEMLSVPTLEPLSQLPADDEFVAARWTADMRWFVTVNAAQVVTLHDPETLEPLVRLGESRATDTLSNVQVFSLRGGEVILAALNDRPQLWDVASRQRIGGTFPNDQGITWAANDGVDAVVTGIGDNAVMWNLDFGSWAEIACRAAGRNLTRAEWDELGPSGEPYHPTCSQWPAAEGF